MDLLQLKYFKLLAEKQHLRKTAEQLHISSPSLSATLSRLEEELGVQLFDRTKNRLKLNQYGCVFLRHVNDAFFSLENAIREINDLKSSIHNKLNVAVTTPTIYHKAFEAFLAKYPNISVSYSLVKTDDWQNNDTNTNYDLILTSPIDIVDENWNFETLCNDDSAMLAIYKGHPLSYKKEINFVETKDEKFIALSVGYSLRRYFDLLCYAAGFIPKIIIECDYQMRSKLVSERYGITLTTESGMRSQSQTWDVNKISFIQIKDPGVKRTQGILWNKHRYIGQAAILFRNFIINYYRSHPFGD